MTSPPPSLRLAILFIALLAIVYFTTPAHSSEDSKAYRWCIHEKDGARRRRCHQEHYSKLMQGTDGMFRQTMNYKPEPTQKRPECMQYRCNSDNEPFPWCLDLPDAFECDMGVHEELDRVWRAWGQPGEFKHFLRVAAENYHKLVEKPARVQETKNNQLALNNLNTGDQQDRCMQSTECTSHFRTLLSFCSVGSTVTLAPDVALKALGYGTAGIRSGSIAAWLMRNGLNSRFLQSYGARALGPVAQTAVYLANKVCAVENPCDCGKSAREQPTPPATLRGSICSAGALAVAGITAFFVPVVAPAALALTGGCFSLDIFDAASTWLDLDMPSDD